MEKKTPLYEAHVAAGGKMVPFAGYLLPVEYPTGVITEHLAVRQACGLFDVSHMGEVLLTGPDALRTLNHLMTNDYTSLAPGRVRYSTMCNEQGGVVDDLVVYHCGDVGYLVVVNAANREKDVQHMRSHLVGDTKLEDISDRVAQLALQGPRSADILCRLMDRAQLPQKYYSFTSEVTVAGITCMVSRTGYTGELGYELYCAHGDALRLWSSLLAAGQEDGLIPCGLGARDTLRLEAAMPLYGHEMDDTVSPLETGLDFAVKLESHSFIGQDALRAHIPPARARIGLKATGRGIIREHQTVYRDGKPIGQTTSGTYCPYLKGSYAMALIEHDAAVPGDAVTVDVRGRMVAAEVVPLPFYKRS